MMKIRHRGRLKNILLIFIATGILIQIGQQIRQIIRGIEGDTKNTTPPAQVATEQKPQLPPHSP